MSDEQNGGGALRQEPTGLAGAGAPEPDTRLGSASGIPSAAIYRAVADKCETLGGGMELDAAIAVSLGWTDLRSNQGGLNGKPPSLYTRGRVPKFSRSVDAARTLVPGDWLWSVGGGIIGDPPAICACLWKDQLSSSRDATLIETTKAQTPALALCTVALRALASAIEARSDATGTGAAEGESAGPQDDAKRTGS